MLTEEQWETAENFKALFEPFKLATTLMSADKYPTASNYVPVVQTLKKMCTEFKFEERYTVSEELLTLQSTLLSELNVRFENILSNETLILAMVLDPRFKTRFLAENDKQNTIEKLKRQCARLSKDVSTVNVTNMPTCSNIGKNNPIARIENRLKIILTPYR